MVVASPREIAGNPQLSAALAPLVPAARLDAYAVATGLDLRKVPSAAVAGFDLGTLSVAELPGNEAPLIRERFASRLRDGGIERQRVPGVRRITGTEADAPRGLVTVDNHIVALATGDLTLTRIVEAYAERRLRSPTALQGAALSPLPRVPESTLVSFYAPGPFVDEWMRAGRGLLESALAVQAGVESRTDGWLAVTLTLAGDFRKTEDVARLEAAWSDLAGSSTGRLLGFDRATRIVASEHPPLLTLSLQLPLAPLVAGLRAVSVANVSEIFQVIPSPPAQAPLAPP